MKARLFILAVLALVAAGCAKTEMETPAQKQGQTLTLTASMPAGRPETRLALAETDAGDLSVKWKAGDRIGLCFVSGETVKTLSDIPVTNIREEGKKADFFFSLPEGIDAPFNLYGIYGAAFKSENSGVVQLNANEADELDLDYAGVRSAMRFALNDIPDASSVPTASFEHLGSIMKVDITNVAGADITVNSLRISGKSDASNMYDWLYGSEGDGENAEYDLAAGTFVDTREKPSLMFSPVNGKTIASGDKCSLYRWFIPTETPAVSGTFNAMLSHDDGIGMCDLPYKAFEKGKHYRLKLVWNGTELKRPALPPASDLVAHWPMDGNANDVSGNEHHGTIFGGVMPTEDHKGRANGAYLFNGTDGYIDVGDWENGGAMTFTFWARWDAYPYFSKLLDFGNGASSNNIYIMNYGTGSTFEFGVFHYSSQSYMYGNVGIPLNTWVCYTITIEASGTAKIYKDGVLTANKTLYVPQSILRTRQYIGNSSWSNSRFFKGAIGDLRMYNRALTDDEVMGLYLSTQ